MKSEFTRYQIFVIALLAFIQFTVVLDFMILSPLGVMVMDQLHVTTTQFGLVVSAYAFSAGASGILAAGFADSFDRKKFLLFFYFGFVIGTVLCGIAPTYSFLLFARIITGIFAGVIASISFAIIADLFPLEVRGRVMGLVMTAFAASQVFGLPIGIFISNLWGWKAAFLMIAAVSGIVGVIAFYVLEPITAHLKEKSDKKAILHLIHTLAEPKYLPGFLATMLLATGGFMLMPFGSAFTVHNMGISQEDLPLIYMSTGVASIVAGPRIGRLSDRIGKYIVFVVASIVAIGIVLYYTQLGISPLWFVIALNSALFIPITARMISANALTSAIPEMKDRGAYMAISSSLQQLSGGIAAAAAGMIVVQTPSGHLQGYENLGYVVSVAILVTVFMMYRVNRLVNDKAASQSFGKNVPVTEKVGVEV